ncbi:type I polyketide synthase [Streptomyces caelestis]|uniref:Phenolphthiocerol/phthiocerol polyketide synthase subunit E n=1 Tax=Streptomyces caelestis TaxID=36816 RepID=A0A7W9GY69_9ACTN|nr:type I polyketide synthase [Streptomyces caelestis]MBB5792199.1 acyl transferase domain-containing protein/thioesterase domain-containing protein/SAM-dependent methyltransferase/acyl carrier protein [Streptomyces caelestis]GGW83132.1 hypothetical protein GCM10010320_76450 [Streptomyces caelestis]
MAEDRNAAGADLPDDTGGEELGIAVVGMAGRWAHAEDIEQFWRNLLAGHESVTPVPDEAFLAAGGSPADLQDPSLVRMAAGVEGIELFDAGFFGYSPAEARQLDPQQRLFLEVCHHAMEHAGYDPARFGGQVGVYAGCSQSEYFLSHIQPRYANEPGSLALLNAKAGNLADSLATRVSYELDLTGPSMTVQTACSTSLVAVHVACQDLLNYRCDTALAGGAALNPSAVRGYRHVEQGVLSPDGRTRAFDAEARGTVRGDGVAAVALRRLEDALADGDHIWGVIKGSAINNDGRRKPGFTAPSPEGQTEAILDALMAAEVPAETISYVEAHGTGTPVGDPIEVEALRRAFRQSTDRTGFCLLGSVKPNVGHTDAAAGVTGLIKVLLAMRHGVLPPTVGYRRPNPAIDFAATPFRVSGEAEPWRPDAGVPRRAGVSSFGVGGTNAHAVVEEPPVPPAPAPGGARTDTVRDDAERDAPDGRARLLRLSARTPDQLDTLCTRLSDHLSTRGTDLRPDDVAFTLAAGRREFDHRRTLICHSVAEAADLLRRSAGGPVTRAGQAPGAVFLLPGGGAQYPDMGAGLYRTEPVFRAEMDRASEVMLPVLGHRLTDALYGGPEPAEPAQFASLVAVEYALARLMASHGVTPAALLGHSLGEYTAACLAGVMSFEDALMLVDVRDRLTRRIRGATLGVWLPEQDLLPYLEGGEVDLATVNSQSSCTVSGTEAAVADLERRLEADGVEFSRVRLTIAPHSRLLESVLPEFAAVVETVSLRPPKVPVVSNVTGTWMTAEQATDPGYWVRHMRRTVRFAEGLGELARSGYTAFAEVGPGRGLARHVRAHLGQETTVVPMMRHAKSTASDVTEFLDGLGGLWAAGVPVPPPPRGEARRVPLPGYPFERTRHWVERVVTQPSRPGPVAAPESAGLPFDVTVEADEVRAAESRWRDRLPPAPLPDAARGLVERFCTLEAVRFLQRSGIGTAPGAEYDLSAVHHRVAAVGGYRRFVEALTHVLAEDGLVEIRDGRLRFVAAPEDEARTEAHLRELRARVGERFPDFLPDLELIRHCADRYAEVVGGRTPGARVLRPDGEDLAGPVLGKWTAAGDAEAYRSLLVEQVARLAGRIHGRGPRVLEIGNLNGPLWQLADALAGIPGTVHRFAGPGRAVVLGARQRAEEEQRTGTTFEILDISRDPAGQGFAPGHWDIVVAHNALHAVGDVPAALPHVRSLLAPGGALFLLEASGAPRIALFTAGLLEGWWSFTDGLRERSPFIGPERWCDALSAAGFDSAASFPGERRADVCAPHTLVIGRRPAEDDAPGDASGEVRPTAAAASGQGTALAPRPALGHPYAAPRTDVERDIARHWQDALGIEDIGIHDNFFDLHGDSLLAVQLANRISKALGVTVRAAALLRNPTVAGLAEHIGRGDTPSGMLDVLLPLRAGDTGIPLFCFHPVAGIAWPYAALLPDIDARFPVYGLQSRGLTEPAAMPDSVERTAADLLREIRAVRPSGPYALLGWSFGGMVAHAAAAQLEQAGERVALLAVLDAFPAAGDDGLSVPDHEEAARFLHRILLAAAGVEPAPDEPAMDTAAVVSRLRDSGSALSGLDEQDVGRIVDVLRRNTEMISGYRPSPTKGDLLTFTATDSHDPSATPPAARWKPLVGGSVDNRDLPCDHQGVLRGEALRIVGAELNAALRGLNGQDTRKEP